MEDSSGGYDLQEPLFGFDQCSGCEGYKPLESDGYCRSCLISQGVTGLAEPRKPAPPAPVLVPDTKVVGCRWPGLRGSDLKFTEFEARLLTRIFGGKVERA